MVKTANSLNKFTKNFSIYIELISIGHSDLKQKITGLSKVNIKGKAKKMAKILHKNTIITSYGKKEEQEENKEKIKNR